MYILGGHQPTKELGEGFTRCCQHSPGRLSATARITWSAQRGPVPRRQLTSAHIPWHPHGDLVGANGTVMQLARSTVTAHKTCCPRKLSFRKCGQH